VVPPEANVFEDDYDQNIDPELHARLMEMFRFDIQELERLLERVLSAWHSR
jgi:uncharacterized protein YprB with RNaseH-like and TPR domain